MRRALILGIALILGGVILASASALDVSGGTVQVFRYEVEITIPTTTIPVEMPSGSEVTIPPDTEMTATTVGP